jgi:hypothetical protein
MIPRRAITPTKSRAALLSQRPLGRFDRSRLPDPLSYYTAELGTLQGRGEWRSAVCVFHDDHAPSLRVNLRTGGFKCMVCQSGGSDLLSFHQQRHGADFKTACKALGCWIEAQQRGNYGRRA